MRLISNTINVNFISKMKLCAMASTLMVVVGLVSFMMRGENNFGIDFTGGVLQQAQYKRATSAQDVRDSLKAGGVENASIQEIHGEEPIFIVRSAVEEKEAVRLALEKVHGSQTELSIQREEMVGPAVGHDLRRQGIWAIVFSLLGILFYISWRFEFIYALGAIVALFHDVLITVGVLSLCHVEISLQILAALLTIVGYSLNDTIVVFDRIRETLKLHKKESFEHIINKSINQTLSRTLLTSGTTLIVVAMLQIFGGEVIHDFAFALLIGIVVGTYSSIYIASALLVFWSNKKQATPAAVAPKTAQLKKTKKK